MNPPNYLPEIGIDDRPPRRQPEPPPIADESLLLDHHVDEALAALSDLAGLQRSHSTLVD
jgi:hypothetical protein